MSHVTPADISLLHVSIVGESNPAPCTMGTGAKVRPGRAADPSPPSSAKVMEE